MLYLTRKIGESVVINDDIEVTVVEVRGRSIKLGFTFPPHVSVLRREIYERIQAENQAAARSSDDSGADSFAESLRRLGSVASSSGGSSGDQTPQSGGDDGGE